MKIRCAERSTVEGVHVNESALLRDGSAKLLARTIQLSMRRWREEAGYTQKDAAARLNRTLQHISNLETKRLPGQSDLEILLLFYGKDERVPFMRELLRAAREKTNWWQAFAVPEWFELFLALESGAAEIVSYDAVVVPELLQVTPYARAVVRGDPDLTDDEVEAALRLRAGRQRIFDRSDPPHVWTVLDESVLHRVRGDRRTTARQFEHLLAVSERPGVDLQVLPFRAAVRRGGSFQLLAFPPEVLTEAGVVYVELLPGGRYLEDPGDVALYRHELARLRALALDQKASRELIARRVQELA